MTFGLLFEEGLCVRLEVQNLPIFLSAVHTVLLLPVVVGRWVVFDTKESFGRHGHEHYVSDVLLSLFRLFLREVHHLDVLRDVVVRVVVLAHGVLESQDGDLVVARHVLFEVDEDRHWTGHINVHIITFAASSQQTQIFKISQLHGQRRLQM